MRVKGVEYGKRVVLRGKINHFLAIDGEKNCVTIRHKNKLISEDAIKNFME